MTHIAPTTRCLAKRALLSVALALAAFLPQAEAAGFPEKPIKIYATAAPGAATDIVARLLAEHMSRTLKQQVLVENQGGGGTTIALGLVARAPADGYTLAVTATAMVAAPFLYSSLPFDVEKSFAPVSQLVTFYNILVANPNFPAKTLADFIPYAKQNTVSLASGNLGGQSWVMTLKLNKMAGTKIKYLAYRGSGPALTDVMGGHVQTSLSDLASMKDLLATGKLRAIAVTTPKRTASLPDVPAFAEAVPGYEQQGWLGMLAPAGTPKDVLQTIHKAVAAALADPVIHKRLTDGDFGIVGSTPDEFAALIKKELVTYGDVIKDSGVKLD